MKRAVVIVAGGSGVRMGGEIPKQYLELAGKPLIIHVLDRFLRFDSHMEIVLVMAPSHRDLWRSLGDKYSLGQGILLAEGGKSRYESVKNGLDQIKDERVVGIHDAVRPLVSHETLERCYSSGLKWGSGIPVIAMEDSVRKLDGNEGSTRMDRSLLRRVQTPQVFLSRQIKQAYQKINDPDFTDDAAVYESLYGKVQLVKGNRENIKITTPSDMIMAEALIQSGD